MQDTSTHSALRTPNPAFAPPRPFFKRLKNGAIYYGVRALLTLIRSMPRRVALTVCGGLGLCAYACAPGTRRRTYENLLRAFGREYDTAVIRRWSARVFWELGRNAVDAVRLSKITRDNVDDLIRVTGMQYLEDAYAQGHGVIAVSGHIGNFELMGAYLAFKGYPMTAVATALYDPRLDAILNANRARSGLRMARRERAGPAVLRALKRGEVVGLLVDQDTRVQGTFVEFFGRPAYTPIGPALMASRTGALIVPMAIHRTSDDTHEMTIHPPIPVTGRSDQDIHDVVQQYTRVIEAFIKEAPTQWVWMHDRWKTRPDGED